MDNRNLLAFVNALPTLMKPQSNYGSSLLCFYAFNTRSFESLKNLITFSHLQMGGGTPNYTIPDWRQYKVENAPELVQVQRALASHGLKDPWLRYVIGKI